MPFEFATPVRFADVDHAGIVYYPRFFHYFHMAFEELFRRFKRGIEAAGILRDYRRKQRFKPAHEERRDKIRAAGRKLRRAAAKRSA